MMAPHKSDLPYSTSPNWILLAIRFMCIDMLSTCTIPLSFFLLSDPQTFPEAKKTNCKDCYDDEQMDSASGKVYSTNSKHMDTTSAFEVFQTVVLQTVFNISLNPSPGLPTVRSFDQTCNLHPAQDDGLEAKGFTKCSNKFWMNNTPDMASF